MAGKMLVLSVAWLIVVSILISRALRQHRVLRELQEPRNKALFAPPVTAVVPARNEEANIERCLESLAAQDYPPGRFRIVAVDDNSTDRTAALIAKAAASGKVTLLNAPPLLSGWTGKCHACWLGAAHAAHESNWLCFIDADIEANPALLRAAVELALSEDIQFLSLAPRQIFLSFAERLVMPCGFYLLGFCQDLSKINSPACNEVTATGMFMLIRSDAYKAIGGHKAVRGDICEDLALARLAKKRGYHVAMFGAAALYSTRMYTGWKSLSEGLSKNFIPMLGGEMRTLAAAIIAVTLAWAAPVIPAFDAVRCAHTQDGCIALALAAPASAAIFGLHLGGAAFFRIPFWYGLVFPLGYTVGAALAIDSLRRRLSGQVRWKGRTYS
jgi:chlorobactene glucosyltransferase